MTESQADTCDIDLSFEEMAVAYCIKTDRTRLKQVLIKLLFNAIKYNKTGGAVAVEYTLSPPDSRRISVTDTGLGMTPEQLAQFFQPFNRLGQETGSEEGTGMARPGQRHRRAGAMEPAKTVAFSGWALP